MITNTMKAPDQQLGFGTADDDADGGIADPRCDTGLHGGYRILYVSVGNGLRAVPLG
jgi:hypothetical protein